MGRTIPSFRLTSVEEEREWKVFRNALDKSDRRIFDKMFSIPHLYDSACCQSYKNTANINVYEDIWIVTNWHVFFGTNISRPDKLSEIKFKTRRKTPSDSPSWNDLVIHGEDLKGIIRIYRDTNEDVAVVKITDKIEKVHPNIDQGYVFFAVSGTLLPDKSAVFVVLRSVTMLSLLVTLRAFMMKKTYFRL